jgi:peptidyl-prolyl cis-trans isomerase B (cyclophilin B)
LAGSRERERRRARERFEQQRGARLERQRRNRKRAGIGLAVLCVLGLIAGVSTILVSGGGAATAAKKPAAKVSATASPSASATASASPAAVTEPATHCSYTSSTAGSVVKASLPTASPDYKAAYTASINTNLGPIKIDLANSKATCTVNSFVHLASDNFWNNTQCHRVSDSDGLYMLQCGDPTAKASEKLSCSSSTLGSGTPGYEFASENLPTAGSSGSVTYAAGTVAMANTGSADSNGSQFFLVFKNTTLGPDYTPFGTITSGLDILQNVAKAGTSCTYSAGGGVPKDKVVIDSVSINKT